MNSDFNDYYNFDCLFSEYEEQPDIEITDEDNLIKKISNSIYEFKKKNKNVDLNKVDVIIKKRKGKYTVNIDNKREEKLKEIFKFF